MSDNLADWEIVRFHDGGATKEVSSVAEEYPITIIINGKEFATMVCSPEHVEELIVGFLASEGVIFQYKAIQQLTVDVVAGFAYLEIEKLPDTYQEDHSKRFIGSCCGKSRQFYFKNDVKTAKTIMSNLSLSCNQCLQLMTQLQQASNQFRQTGGVHNAALATVNDVQLIRTDIGRHNALDKLYGHMLMNQTSVRDKVIVFSGRVSSEVLLKIAKMRISILISKSAPTKLALELAEDLGITVIGFVRKGAMNVYTHHDRVEEITYDKKR
ncbi:sulfurtransferase FdhD [Virgibacillus pantothenticus]|uniref:Sulfur carrier protein FdhD n=1 Tax=Virgibacillus pantothenticus TaxID=1473 RepID=A0A0L0QS57_VIRPA|nr:MULTISPECIES: formate dehydrogenase accessory sulfurtransferase FdhD [Virgibacillus]API91957.1 sufurtransferase FdhD [Virgibacillus sp. 6R]KNE21411.1 formate dehydrogenase [Virgibacillus pantothenticus]MBS7430408.1 formate dehydrogenase accessory sulfurtransferase FdhD [Virgibacillus sp. 19R1-5]MBU8567322.1 formate dehydrogenase accessory sulfurtransferase FdhD [Virgibacillus pantothenticus]MBU8598903.1 formate dehydrogenase accessory sulfurtransferase FdhD [Virgibacillus pantothenticus]